MTRRLACRARKLGDDVNTDYIIASSRKKATLDPRQLKEYLFETIDPDLASSIQSNDVLVAGKNFGCGSAMEVAVTAVMATGIPAVLAQSFARAYSRNAVNNGLIPIECDTTEIAELDALTIVLEGGRVRIRNETRACDLSGATVTGVALDILDAGGLVAYVRRHGGFPE